MTNLRSLAGLLKLRQHASNALLLAALSLGGALTEGLALLLLVPLFAALGAGSAEGGRISALLAQIGLPSGLGALLILFVVLAVLRAVIGHLRALAALRLEVALVDGLRQRAWAALLHCDWRVLLGMRQADTVSLLVTDLDRIGYGLSQAMAGLAAAVTLGGIALAAVAISVPAAIGAVLGGLLVLTAYRRMRQRAAGLGERLGEAYADVHGRLHEGLGALRVIKSFGREARAEAESTAGLAGLRSAQLAFQRDRGLGQIALQGGGALALAVLVWLGTTRWQVGASTILPLAALFARALPLLGAMQEAWQNWAHSRPAISAALALIDRAEAAREADAPEAPAPALADEIRLSGVSVHFAGAERAALDDVSLIIPARSTLLLAGPSGAGKSTLADLIGGLLSLDTGSLTIDGQALKDGVRRAWRTRVAYVQQDPVLLRCSIRDNLLWAVPDADEGQLNAALDAASAGFVMALPQGIDTKVGDGERRLSGGERQRIVLARALLRDPALLVLDEATSALDPANETAVAEALARLKGKLTIVIIGHHGRLAALADQVVTLQDGRITG